MNKEELITQLQALVDQLSKGTDRITKERILADLQAGKISVEEASRLLGAQQKALYCKVSEKGGLSVYGLQRMPVTLYVEQWERLLAYADEIQAFMKENNARLKRKEV